MKTAATAVVLLVLAAGARAEDAKERLKRAVADLGEQEGYTLASDWKIEVEKMAKPTKGTVSTVVKEKGGFLKLNAVFEDGGEVTVYQRGERIAGLDPETKEWGPIGDDKRAVFVTRMFNLKEFLGEVAGMATDPQFRRDETFGQQECLVIETPAEPAALGRLLADARAGKALVGNELRNPTMTARILVGRKDGLVQRVELTIEGDAVGEKPKPEGKDPETGEDWEEAPADGERRAPGGADPPKKEDPQPAGGGEPVVQHVKIWINATTNYKADRTIEIPDSAKKVLGLGN